MRTRWIVAAALAAVGLIWTGQGLGILRGTSFMVGDARWAIAGVVLLVTAVGLGLVTLLRRSRA